MKKGEKYNRLTAIRFDHKDKWGNHYWLFKCDCGNETIKGACAVRNNKTKSCGCLQKENNRSGKNSRIHGMEGTPIYNVWLSMKQRCLNKNRKDYEYYGGRGIKVCKRWLKFENFYADMGDRPKGKSLDRIDNNGNYEPKNCRWATTIEQSNNKRNNVKITYNGKTLTISQWARMIGVDMRVIWSRINVRHWSIKKTLTTRI